MERLLDWFWTMTLPEAAFWTLVENVLVFAVSVGSGELLVRAFAHRRVVEEPEPLEWQEVALATGCVVLNAVVTLAGWYLWKTGIIRIRRDLGWWVFLDLAALFGEPVSHCFSGVDRLELPLLTLPEEAARVVVKDIHGLLLGVTSADVLEAGVHE